MSDAPRFRGVVGVFATADALRAAALQARRAGIAGATAYLPVADRASVRVLEPAPALVERAALAGGLTGIAAALAMTIWMSWNYPLVVGGKPITSWPPFLIIAFEWMVLFGAVGAVLGFLRLAHLPDLTPSDAYRPEYAVNRFALAIPCAETGESRERAEGILRDAGAVEVREVREKRYTPLQEVA